MKSLNQLVRLSFLILMTALLLNGPSAHGGPRGAYGVNPGKRSHARPPRGAVVTGDDGVVDGHRPVAVAEDNAVAVAGAHGVAVAGENRAIVAGAPGVAVAGPN